MLEDLDKYAEKSIERPTFFNQYARDRHLPIMVTTNSREAIRLSCVSDEQFPFATASIPYDGSQPVDEFDPWLKQLDQRDVVIWPGDSAAKDTAALHTLAERIASYGAASVGIADHDDINDDRRTGVSYLIVPGLKQQVQKSLRSVLSAAQARALPVNATHRARAALPHRGSVDTSDVFKQVRLFLERNVSFNHDIHIVFAAWCLHAWCAKFDPYPFDMSPRLILRGKDQASDHAQVLRIIALLVPSPRILTFATGRGLLALAMQQQGSTLLLDDVSGGMISRRDVASMIVAGMQRDGGVSMGAARRYGRPIESCFAPIAIATSYPVPPQMEQNAIVIDIRDRGDLRHKPTPSEALEDALVLRPKIQACVSQLATSLIANKRQIAIIASTQFDRCWLPIFSIAQATSCERNDTTLPQMMRQFRHGLDKDLTLLAHIKDLHQKLGTGHLSTTSIIEHLTEIGYEVRNGTGANARQRGLAERLLQFGLRPALVRLANGDTRRGYRSDDLSAAYRRFLEVPSKDVKAEDVTVTSEM